jgi:hypothetical protein
MLNFTAFYYNWFELYQMQLINPFEVAIMGDEFDLKLKSLTEEFLPFTMILGGDKESDLELLQGKLVRDKTVIYVCVNKTCKLPVEDVDRALAQMAEFSEN